MNKKNNVIYRAESDDDNLAMFVGFATIGKALIELFLLE
jgi:hypothetical protein